MSRQRITAPKLHKFIPVDLHWHDTFKLPGVYERLSAERIIGLDTETFAHRKHGAKWIEGLQRYTDGYRTDLTSMNFSNAELNTVLETTELDHPFEAVFDCLFP